MHHNETEIDHCGCESMGFLGNEQASDSSVSRLLKEIGSIFSAFADQYNAQISNENLIFRVEEHQLSGKGESRLLVRNAYFVISFKANKTDVNAYTFRTSNLPVLLKHEKTLNLKLTLRIEKRQGQQVIVMDDEVVIDDQLATIFMSLFEDVARKSQLISNTREAPRLSMEGKSIATAVRQLVHERNNLLNELLTQNEQLQSSIAREIHDQVISDLLFLKKMMQESGSHHDQIEVLDDAVLTLRDICSGLASRDLLDWGLLPCLRNLVNKLNRKTEGCITLKIEDEPPEGIPAEVQQQVFRIIQEALNNAIKHAEARKIEVRLARQDQNFIFTVGDDGKGLSTRNGGTGIIIMNERVSIINTMMAAELLITNNDRNSDKKGTIVTLHLDLHELNHELQPNVAMKQPSSSS